MIITKRRLVESIIAQNVDAEFYTDATADVYAYMQHIINEVITGDAGQRNLWAFQQDLNAEQMRYLEENAEQITIALVEKNYPDKQIYSVMKAYDLKTPQELYNLANHLLAESVPKL